MSESVKKMVLTGAAVIVMMGFAAPAMAEDIPDSPYRSTYGDPAQDTGGIVLIDRFTGFMDKWF
jgi:hypothetical protein